MTYTNYLLGLDVGSSSVKASLVNIANGECAASAFYPADEAPIKAVKTGWAEQDPEMWWRDAKSALAEVMRQTGARGCDIKAIGISYQMHGLVCVDHDLRPVRDSIIWCDSRAVSYGEKALAKLGEDFCLSHLLNSPGNFTAAKLAWVRENEPETYKRIYKVMLPGDYIAMKLSGVPNTTVAGLSEGIFWDFKERRVSEPLLETLGISADMICDTVPTFAVQSRVSAQAANETGLAEGTPISYRAGDQPNNALSLGVFNPGEIASTAGTSGVVYGVLGKVGYDPKSRVGTFAHVNHTDEATRLGVLLCINGTGCLNSWVRRNIAPDLSYPRMNDLAATVPVGSEGLTVIPFGNGAERVLGNRCTGAGIVNIDLNRHTTAHILRAAQEGIAYSFRYGIDIMRGLGLSPDIIRAGQANLFLSPLFRQTLATLTGARIELFNTDGALGAARGAALGAGLYKTREEAFASLRRLEVVEPVAADREALEAGYRAWVAEVERKIQNS